MYGGRVVVCQEKTLQHFVEAQLSQYPVDDVIPINILINTSQFNCGGSRKIFGLRVTANEATYYADPTGMKCAPRLSNRLNPRPFA